MRTHFFDSATCAAETEEQPSTSPTCGAHTRSGAPCDRHPEPGRRRCRLHGGGSGVGAPAGNANARKHGLYSAKSRELQALGRVQLRTGELLQAHLAAMEARAHGDPRRVTVAEERVSQCKQQLAKAALVLDRVLVERGDEEGRRRLVDRALRLTEKVGWAEPMGARAAP